VAWKVPTGKEVYSVPVDYRNYLAEWSTVIHPRILARAGNAGE